MSFFVLPSWYLFNWFILNSLFFSFSLLSSFFVFCCNFIFSLSVFILTVIPSIYRVIKFFPYYSIYSISFHLLQLPNEHKLTMKQELLILENLQML